MVGGRADALEVREVSTSSDAILAYLDLFRVFRRGHLFNAAYLRWEYDENPDGVALGFDAWDGNTLAAHYVTQPMRACLDGVVRRGLLSLNTATSPAYQGQGLFTALASRTYAAAIERGFDFVVGVSNEKSTHGLVKHLGFTLLGPLEARVGFTGAPSWRTDVSVAYERMWSEDALRWRTRNPARRYWTCRHGSSSVVLTETEYPGLVGVLSERAEASVAPAASWRVRAMPRLWIGIDPRRRFGSTSSLVLPTRFRPAPLNLIFRALRDDVRVPRRDELAFSLIDFDIL